MGVRSRRFSIAWSLPMATNVENLSLQDKKIYRFPKITLTKTKS